MSKLSFAIDIGTTNIETAMIACCGLDMKVLDDRIIKNPQSVYGSDVINRVAATIRNSNNLTAMKNKILAAVKDVIATNLYIYGYDASDVDKICICGNTAMISIIMGYDISGLGYYPFKHTLDKSIITNGNQIFPGYLLPETEVFLSGCAGAFIGGDILAGLYYLEGKIKDKNKKEESWLLLDLGTNGEMILKHKGKYYGTSTACGPAFEGCTRKQNVYGYSTIDAIALGLAAGKIERNGALRPNGDKMNITISGVALNQDIIEQIMLAKAGIYTGIEMLAEYGKATLDDIREVYISGGFGFNLNLENGVNIGLIPESFLGKTRILGNTSLKGAIALLNDINSIPAPIDKYNIDILQLANDKKFQDRLLDNLYFARK